ncbi:winged helix-turn-helix transcriptional regulator [Acidianus sulfidivorans JP7]|uniref:AsnC family transcriptional regulator n=1 Tax=Acidianus sulfidivorans JP7 TaxID=619593 RepID=A0A2U9IPA3_9CREN|nr:winged helix-turn-helix transcriptional regulator [Acidianus sulfidivorans]AWR97878.1 winged helix-turn-helix transcriptional regulator [Acidianus sulfidivorans JP7]
MDDIDKKILFYLFKDGRISFRNIASLLNLTPPSVIYRIKKLEEDEILKGYALFVNPNFYNKYYSFVAFKNIKDLDKNYVFLKFKCVEWLNVYGIFGNSISEIEDKISDMREYLGEYTMKYIPNQNLVQPKEIDQKIISILKENPRYTSGDISKILGIESKHVSKRLEILKKRGYFTVLPIIDIPKSNVSLFSIFSKRVDKIKNILEQCKIMEIVDGNSGIQVCFSENINTVRKYVMSVRDVDPEADVMIIYDYYLSSPV